MNSLLRSTRRLLSGIKGRAVAAATRTKWKMTADAVSAETVLRDLEHGGVRRGDLLVVHASLSQIGNLEGGAETICGVLETLVGEDGTIVMPTYYQPRPLLEMLAEHTMVDLRTAPSATGKISEVFRERFGVTRSSHPFSSCSAWGAHGRAVTTGHDATPFLCGPGSPLANSMTLNGRILGLGVGLGPISFYHVVEDTWDAYPVRTRLPESFECTYINHDGQTICRDLYILDPSVSRTRIERNDWFRDWFRKHLLARGILREFPVGQATCWLMDTKPLYAELQSLATAGITIYSTQANFPSSRSSVSHPFVITP